MKIVSEAGHRTSADTDYLSLSSFQAHIPYVIYDTTDPIFEIDSEFQRQSDPALVRFLSRFSGNFCLMSV